MAIFRRKKDADASDAENAGQANGQVTATEGASGEGGGGDEGGGSAVGGGFEPDPDKAKKFFSHARAMHESTNYEYAMTLWLQGMKWDPTDLSALENFYDSAMNFMATGKGKGATKEQLKNVSGKTPLEKHLQNVLVWGAKPSEWTNGVKAMESAAKLGLVEQVVWIGEQVLPVAQNDRKAKKDQFVKIMEQFEAAGAYDLAERAGESAIAQDPQDAKLIAYVKNLTAQATMSRGGFEGGVASGHFRRNIKDADRQRELEEEESLSKTEETLERMITRAKTRVRENADDQDAVGKLIRLLLERGREEDEKLAYKLSMQAHQRFKNYRWKQQADDIQMRVAHRKLTALRQAAQHADEGSPQQQQYRQAREKVLEMEIGVFRERVQNYPTDLELKFKLGVRLFQMGHYEEAIGHFQRAKDATGIGSQVRNYLAKAFFQLGWLEEAEDTYREGINGHASSGDRLGLELRYGLMEVLARRAKEQQDLEPAKEASELAGKIAMQQFDYRDIKDKREELQGLVKELRSA